MPSDVTTDWLTRKGAAAYLTSIGCPLSPKTLANYAVNNNRLGGPPYSVVGWSIVRYRRSDLEEWAKRKVRRVA